MVKDGYVDKSQVPVKVSEIELKNRVHQIEEIVNKFRSLDGYVKNPSLGIFKIADIENQVRNTEAGATEMTDKQLLDKMAQKDKEQHLKVAKRSDEIKDVYNHALDTDKELKGQINAVEGIQKG